MWWVKIIFIPRLPCPGKTRSRLCRLKTPLRVRVKLIVTCLFVEPGWHCVNGMARGMGSMEAIMEVSGADT